MTKDKQEEHIKAVGDRWNRILTATTMSVRLCPQLIGLDKIRNPMALQAALKATGADIPGFVVGKSAGQAVHGLQDILDAAFNAAVEAGEKAFIAEPV